MTEWHDTRKPRWILVAIAGLLATGLFLAQPAAADDLDELDSALKIVPRNAAFYGSWLRGREQVPSPSEAGNGDVPAPPFVREANR